MSFPEFSIFASPDFSQSEYANAILAGDSYPESKSLPFLRLAQEPSARENISDAIAKLTYGIDDITKQIKNLVKI